MKDFLDFIKYQNWIEILKKNDVTIKLCDHPGIFLLSYNQGCRFQHPMTLYCRGTIIDVIKHKIIANPFPKFFNYGEPNVPVPSLDRFTNYQIVEKLDGSMLKLYYYAPESKWKWGGTGTTDITHVNPFFSSNTFGDLIQDIISESNQNVLFSRLNKNNTYLFEIIHPESRITVDYHDDKFLYFIGVRNNDTDEDYNIFYPEYKNKYRKMFGNFKIKFPNVYDYSVNDIEALYDKVNDFNKRGIDYEGFVLNSLSSDNRYILNRLKIKSKQYFIFSKRVRQALSSKQVLETVRYFSDVDLENFIADLPDFLAHEYIEYYKKYMKFKKEVIEFVDYYENIFKSYDLEFEDAMKKLALRLNDEDVLPVYRGFVLNKLRGKDIDFAKISTSKLLEVI